MTNLKALAEDLKLTAKFMRQDGPLKQAVDETAALLAALAEPLGVEPPIPELRDGDWCEYKEAQDGYQKSLADYFRTAYLQARAELHSVKQVWELLEGYIRHKKNCDCELSRHRACTCGLAAALKQEF